MNCPVCKVHLEFEAKDLDEVYYDCSNCNSSLLFKNGECEVLSEGKVDFTPPDPPSKEEMAIPAPSDQEPSSPETAGASSKSQESVELEAETPAKEQELVGEEASSASFQEESAGDIKPEGESEKKRIDNLPEASPAEAENETEEEDFIPNETTQVPELNQPEETPKNLEPEAQAKESLDENSASLKEGTAEDSPEPEEQPTPTASEKSSNFISSEEAVDSLKTEPAEEAESLVFEETADQPAPEVSESENKAEDFSEVAEFGNSQNQDKQGAFLYDLILSEINSKDTREKVVLVLEDESLSLPDREESQSIESDIKDGKIVIKKISPVQVYVIVTSLMGLALNISWRQSHIAD